MDIKTHLDFMTYKLGRCKPRYCNFKITEKCNSRCAFCNVWKTANPKEMTLQTIKQIFGDPFLDGLRWVQLTGGEPTLHSRLVEIIRFFSLRFKDISIITSTNGINTKNIIQQIKKVVNENLTVNISIDGKPSTHNKLRGGNYAQTLKTVKALSKLPVNMGIGFTITPENWIEIEDVYSLAERLDIHFSCRPVQLSSIYYKNATQRYFFKEGVCDFLERFFGRIGLTPYRKGMLEYLRNSHRLVVPCTALRNSFYLDVDGTVYPCVFYDSPLGNLEQTGMEPLWNSAKVEMVRENIAGGKCPNCWVKCETSRNIKYDRSFVSYANIIIRRLKEKARRSGVKQWTLD